MWESITAKLKGWRTIILNGSVAVGLAAGEVVQWGIGFDWTQVLSARHAALAVIGLNVANIILRAVTTGPVGSKV